MKVLAHLYHILESVQYGLFYMIAAFLGGVGLDFLFPKFTDTIEVKQLIFEITGQCMLLVILTYIIRTRINKIPILFPFSNGSGYKPYKTHEFDGEMMMGLVFLSSQLNLIWKIDLLAKKLYGTFQKEKKQLVNTYVKPKGSQGLPKKE
jgi:hypothetical protein